jgi:hypothetical protein
MLALRDWLLRLFGGSEDRAGWDVVALDERSHEVCD